MTTIEDLQPQHFERVAGWLSEKPINRWLTGEWRNRETTPTLLAITVRNRKNRLFLVRFNGEACGLVGLADIDLADRLGMVWYLLGEDRFAGKGVISGAVRQLVGVAFREMGLACVYAWIMEDNVPSRRVLERCGFREAGSLRDAVNSDGRQVARIYFDLIPQAAVESQPVSGSQ
jgi:RimJ/RimL family protein N-acetyltransferase